MIEQLHCIVPDALTRADSMPSGGVLEMTKNGDSVEDRELASRVYHAACMQFMATSRDKRRVRASACMRSMQCGLYSFWMAEPEHI
jgi:hypothetical protein